MKINNQLLTIGLIIIALLMFNVKKEATTYVQFRTSDLTYPSAGAIAFKNIGPTGTPVACGLGLDAFGYYSACGSNLAGTCASKMPSNPSCSGATLLLENLPGGWISGGSAPSLWWCTGGNICVCDDDGSTMSGKKYNTDDTDQSNVATTLTSTDPTKELTCSGTTPPDSCTDSDNGLNYLTKGTLTWVSGGVTNTYTDTCTDSDELREEKCTSATLYDEPAYISCSAQYGTGYTCSDGTCVPPAAQCNLGDKRCVAGYTDKYQTCLDNLQWSGNLICSSGLTCYLGDCCTVVNGAWTPFSSWSTCSSCTQTRTRTCTNPAPSCGGSTCSGLALESQSCGLVNGGWSTYGAWGTCIRVSGCSGTQTQSRTCTNPAPSCGGSTCSGSATNSQSCSLTGNTVADTNCNGCVENQEYSTAKSSWLAFTMDNAIYSPIKSNWLGFTGC